MDDVTLSTKDEAELLNNAKMFISVFRYIEFLYRDVDKLRSVRQDIKKGNDKYQKLLADIDEKKELLDLLEDTYETEKEKFTNQHKASMEQLQKDKVKVTDDYKKMLNDLELKYKNKTAENDAKLSALVKSVDALTTKEDNLKRSIVELEAKLTQAKVQMADFFKNIVGE